MKLRKALTITGLFFIILIVLGELLLPTVVESALESRLSQKFSTPHVDVELSASPRLMLLFGRTDSLSVTVKDGQVGQLRVHEMALSGRKAVLDMSSFTAGRLALEQAEALDLTAMFDENGLREALARKINKADNVEVHITDDNVLVTADTNLLGHKAQLSLVGHIVADDGTLYFDTDQFDIQNSPFGTARFGDSLGRIALVKPEQLPLKMRVVSVDQQEGSVIVRAGEE
ncbi:LmeA family phospholipid-binding protein [uncultured Mitsuokella sp.]|uniref:LmeA family phospholipid-binding protein n=1 Tax=uncultured Mitsuokella sp. TaxID=453120 RepID=UPI002590FC7F|nr:LmeA family phospholipid-binding protein [uncultured Mitsuokella sp.]